MSLKGGDPIVTESINEFIEVLPLFVEYNKRVKLKSIGFVSDTRSLLAYDAELFLIIKDELSEVEAMRAKKKQR